MKKLFRRVAVWALLSPRLERVRMVIAFHIFAHVKLRPLLKAPLVDFERGAVLRAMEVEGQRTRRVILARNRPGEAKRHLVRAGGLKGGGNSHQRRVAYRAAMRASSAVA